MAIRPTQSTFTLIRTSCTPAHALALCPRRLAHSDPRAPHSPSSLNRLARANALDILAAQPDGPYLIGGHSYGGAVAMEVALLLEAWGHDVALLIVRGWRGGEAIIERVGPTAQGAIVPPSF